MEHLSSTLWVTEVEDFLFSCLLLYHIYVGFIIVDSKFRIGELPVLFVTRCQTAGVTSGVLGSTSISHPDIITSVCQLERHWLVFVIPTICAHPTCCIHLASMLDKDRPFMRLKCSRLSSCDMECSQQVSVICFHIVCFPSIPIAVHHPTPAVIIT